jgi:hypothetical protein
MLMRVETPGRVVAREYAHAGPPVTAALEIDHERLRAESLGRPVKVKRLVGAIFLLCLDAQAFTASAAADRYAMATADHRGVSSSGNGVHVRVFPNIEGERMNRRGRCRHEDPERGRGGGGRC